MIDPDKLGVENKSQLPSAESGGYGGVSRSALQAMIRAVQGPNPISDEHRKAWTEEALRIMAGSDEERNRLRAIELLNALDASNVKRLEVLDKIHRLDSELPTEITHGVQVVVQEVDPTLNRPE